MESSTWCAIQDTQGVLYIGGDKLFVNDGERWRPYQMGGSYTVRSLAFGPDGRLWASGTNDIGWFSRNTVGDWIYHSLRSELPDTIKDLGDVWNVYPTAQGATFVGDQLVLVWDGTHFKWWRYDVDRRLISTRYHGEVYVSPKAGQLFKVTADGPVVAASKDDLPGQRVFWMGDINQRKTIVTGNSVGWFFGDHLHVPDQTLGLYLKENIITSVAQLHDGSLALGTLRGGIALVDHNLHLQQILAKQTGLPSNEIYGLYVSRDGALWATSRSQVFRVNPLSGVTFFDHHRGLPADGCRDIAFDHGEPVVATDDRLLKLDASAKPGGAFTPIATVPAGCRGIEATADGLIAEAAFGVYNLADKPVRQLYRTSLDVYKVRPTGHPGIYDAAVGKKIVRFSTSQTSTQALTEELPDVALDFLVDASHRIWISTGSKGLLVARLQGGHPAPVEPAQLHYGLPSTPGRKLIARLAGSLVAVGPAGAWWLNPATNRFIPVQNFPAGTPNAISEEDPQGRVWVTLEGQRSGEPPRIGQLVPGAHGIEWQPRAIEGLAAVGVPRALRVQATTAGEVLWIAGSAGLLRVSHPSQMKAVPPPQPLVRAIARGSDGLPPDR